MWVGRDKEKYLKWRSEMQCVGCRGSTKHRKVEEKLKSSSSALEEREKRMEAERGRNRIEDRI
jgi:hypothetical protein